MSNEMKWYDYLAMAREEATNAIEYDHDADPSDVAHDVADSCTPVYNSTILQLAADNVNALALEAPDCIAFDGSPTPVNIIAGNIYEALYQEAFEAAEKAIEELGDGDEDD